MSEAGFSFETGHGPSFMRLYEAAGKAGAPTLVLAHGAGAPQTHPWMVAMARAIALRGVRVFTFDFLYAAQHRRAPDRSDVLEATWLAALDAVRARGESGRPFIGGKSMGGRIATQIAARPPDVARVDVAGLVLLGYPLHPPGKPAQQRKAHLPAVRAPMLFVQGSRDAFGTPDELQPVLRDLPRARLLVIEGGDHSLSVPKKAGVSLEETMARVAGAVAEFTSPP